MADAHDPARLKFETAMRECAPHAAVLEEGLGVLPRRFVADDAPFAQKLQRLERLGAVPSVQAWNMLREVRDTLAHDQPDQPALQAGAWTRLRAAADEWVGLWRVVLAFAGVHGLVDP